jgi:hypothetical protein
MMNSMNDTRVFDQSKQSATEQNFAHTTGRRTVEECNRFLTMNRGDSSSPTPKTPSSAGSPPPQTGIEGARALNRKWRLEEGVKSSASDVFTNPLKKKRSFATLPNLSANDKASGRKKASAFLQFPRVATEKGLAVSSASTSSSGSFNFPVNERLAVSSASSSSSGSFDFSGRKPPTEMPYSVVKDADAFIDLFSGGEVWVVNTPVDEVLKILPNAKRTWVKDKLNGYNCQVPKCDCCVPRLLSEMTENPYGHNPLPSDRWNVIVDCLFRTGMADCCLMGHPYRLNISCWNILAD